MEPRGDFIAGRFVAPSGDSLVSVNPAKEGETVLETAWSADRVNDACDAAAAAAPAWALATMDERVEHLGRFAEALRKRADDIAAAIVLETGKLRSEAAGEVAALVSRFDLMRRVVKRDFAEGPIPGHPMERLRYHPLGVVGVIGPFNYPLHLCHAYAVPSLLLGNCVVIKPSEVAPLAAQRYAEAAQDAELPVGALNV